MSKVYSDKQLELLRCWQHNGLRRINILEGSVRSGKTWISLVLWGLWVATMPREGNYLMVAKTLTSLKRNCLDLLEKLVGKRNFSYSLTQKEGKLFGRTLYLEGVNDMRAEGKIRGMTLQGAYCDELTLLTEDFFTMLLSRLSERGAKLFGTTNPDNPNHWLMKKYIIRREELNMSVVKFLLEDNIFLDPDYIADLKQEYTGVYYDRFILGLWVVAEGLVYPMFSPANNVVKTFEPIGRWFVSVDYGTVNPCSMGLWCLSNGKAVRAAEYYYDSRADANRGKQKTDEEYYTELEKLIDQRLIEYVVVDPSAASFMECIRRHGSYRVRGAVNDVLDGIRFTSSFLQSGKLLIHEGCVDCIREFGVYSWDAKSQSGDKVVKEFDHAMDDVRYFVNTVLHRELRHKEWT